MNGAPLPKATPAPADDWAVEPVQLVGFGPVDLYQKREKIFTRYVGGTFQRLRFYTGWPLLVGYFVTPWLNWGDRQAILFDLPARQFYLFGLTIWPQDLWLLGWMLMIAALGLFTITTMVGRLWCGYTCPQTVWTAIFMWAEQLAEGPRHARMRLEAAPWSLEKLRRRICKHAMWLGWAGLTGLTFVGYFAPIRELSADLMTCIASMSLSGDVVGWPLFWTLFFTAATYVNAGWLREQVCLYMCPYARFQSAMIDRDTLIVSYDAKRGEPRGSRKRGTQPELLGDCTDCQLCVQVCPTGIDIRNGLQYQCIGCAHCVDACAEVMKKMDYAAGLIRYSTLRALDGGPERILRGRSLAYGAVCLMLVIAFVFALFNRSLLLLDIVRPRDVLYRTGAEGTIINDYEVRLANKTQSLQTYSLRIVPGSSVPAADTLTLEAPQNIPVSPGTVEHLNVEVQAAAETVSTRFILQACTADGTTCAEEETVFMTPVPGGLG